jgi:hypothetical protein
VGQKGGEGKMKVLRVITTYEFADDTGVLGYLHSLEVRGLLIPVEEFLKKGSWEFSSGNKEGDRATTRYELVR